MTPLDFAKLTKLLDRILPRPNVSKADVLRRAAEIVEERGYASGSRGMRPQGPVCLLGAIWNAAAEVDDSYAKMTDSFDKYNALTRDSFISTLAKVGVGRAKEARFAYGWSDARYTHSADPKGALVAKLREAADAAK